MLATPPPNGTEDQPDHEGGRVLVAKLDRSRLVRRALVGTAVLFFLLVLPELWWLLPVPLQARPVGVVIGVSMLAGVGLAALGAVSPRAVLARRVVAGAEGLAERALGGGLERSLVAGCLVLLVCWVPHYVFWPWFRDHDTFASIARQWDLGIRPYRDIRSFNFPGHTYIHWILGKVFGWGRTWPFQVFDVLSILGLCGALVAWSRRVLGGKLPGLLASLAVLVAYTELNMVLVAQRDWHATLFVILGLMAAESWPGRRGWFASACFLAMASTIRPHVVLFGPAFLAAVWQSADRGGRSRIRAVGTWAVALLCFLLLGFAPILLSGLAGDLIRSVKIASYGGPFSLFTPEKALATFGSQFRTPWVVVVLLGNLGLSVLGPRGLRRVSRTWTLAMLGVLAYRPLHPVPHEYLRQPLILMSAVAVAPLVAWVAGLGGSNALRTLAILLIVSEAFRDWPSQASPRATAGVAWDLARGRVPRGPFPGGGVWFPLEHRRRGEYQWEDYLDVIDHLRKTTRPETPLANVLRRLPYPSLNGPTGRPSPFRFESGVCWMLVVDEAIDEALAEQLDQAGDAVVVWSPDEGPSFSVLWLPHVTDLIRREFRPSARFGKFEVWRRIGPVGAADLGQGRGVR